MCCFVNTTGKCERLPHANRFQSSHKVFSKIVPSNYEIGVKSKHVHYGTTLWIEVLLTL